MEIAAFPTVYRKTLPMAPCSNQQLLFADSNENCTQKTQNALMCDSETYLDHKPGKLVVRTRHAGSAFPPHLLRSKNRLMAALLYWHSLDQKQALRPLPLFQ